MIMLFLLHGIDRFYHPIEIEIIKRRNCHKLVSGLRSLTIIIYPLIYLCNFFIS